jgi:hypothetical protein
VQAASARAGSSRLSSGLDLILVSVGQTQNACQALARGDADAAWGVPLRGEQMGLLLCPSGQADEGATIRLLATLAQQGAQGVRLHLDRVMDSAELRAWAGSVLAGTGDAQLTSG